MKRIAIALLCSSCSSGPLPIFFIDARSDALRSNELGDFDVIANACDYWSIDCEESDDEDAPMRIMLMSGGGGPSSDGLPHCGETIREDKCSVFVFACEIKFALEHEIGHAFGLEHRNDRSNVMFEVVAESGGVSQTGQRTRVRNGAAKLARCD